GAQVAPEVALDLGPPGVQLAPESGALVEDVDQAMRVHLAERVPELNVAVPPVRPPSLPDALVVLRVDHFAAAVEPHVTPKSGRLARARRGTLRQRRPRPRRLAGHGADMGSGPLALESQGLPSRRAIATRRLGRLDGGLGNRRSDLAGGVGVGRDFR